MTKQKERERKNEKKMMKGLFEFLMNLFISTFKTIK